ncbi:MAG TPA: toll/interleukin-1 receptor domain-containing protein [Polyangia bacterium]|nr:toll/interleukin-1 receptor domain-containing protein [Polyangia bacterium]
MEHVVFISYARDDAETARALDQWLREKGVRVLIDDRDFLPGSDIIDEIVRCIAESGVVVCIYSATAAHRHYPKLERRIADLPTSRSRLIFFCIDQTELPPEAQPRLAVKAVELAFEDAMTRLWAGISGTGLKPVNVDLTRYVVEPPWKKARQAPEPPAPVWEVDVDARGRPDNAMLLGVLRSIRRQMALGRSVGSVRLRPHDSLARLRAQVADSFAKTGRGEPDRALQAATQNWRALESATVLVISKLLRRWFRYENEILQAASASIHLCWVQMVASLAPYQLAGEGLPFFDEYVRLESFPEFVAKVAGIRLEQLAEYRFTMSDGSEREVYVPVKYGGDIGEELGILFLYYLFDRPVSLPGNFLAEYVFPQMIARRLTKPEEWDFSFDYAHVRACGYNEDAGWAVFDVSLDEQVRRAVESKRIR